MPCQNEDKKISIIAFLLAFTLCSIVSFLLMTKKTKESNDIYKYAVRSSDETIYSILT